MATLQVSPIHFEDYSATAFERLVFAFHLRTGRWRSIEWYGQVGSDLGRDVLAVRDDDTPSGEVWCIQCANYRVLPATKAIRDVNKALRSPTLPYHMRFVCGGSVSAATRDKVKAHGAQKHLAVDLWSGAEFEERLRRESETLLRRFVEGIEFPDSADGMFDFVQDLGAREEEAIRLLASVFDRPAFYTPFRHESNVPGFRQALDDTIHALSTGVRKTREGITFPRIPSRHELREESARRVFADVERGVAGLRARFEQLVTSRDIRPCADTCGAPGCSVYMFSDAAIEDMDQIRSRILDELRQVTPTFSVRVDW